ncbi:hypothetical protein C0J52_10835 [Blattella germanica]|nr:hypothetical protein C0J52_10835 [Blattella germanica]
MLRIKTKCFSSNSENCILCTCSFSFDVAVGQPWFCRQVFILQKRSVRLICGVHSNTHCKPLFVELGILTLPSMFVLECLLYVKENIDDYQICTNIHSYPTRNCSNIYNRKCKYCRTTNSFVYMSVQLFNSLPQEVKNLSISVFARKVKATLRANPLYSVDEFYNLEWTQ